MSPTAPARSQQYSVFVLSAWKERDGDAEDEPVWRFSLEGSQLAGRKGFGSLPELMTYLQAWTSSVAPDEMADASQLTPGSARGDRARSVGQGGDPTS